MSGLLCLAVAILGFAGVVVTVCVIDLFVRVSRLEDREMYPRLRALRRRQRPRRHVWQGRGHATRSKKRAACSMFGPTGPAFEAKRCSSRCFKEEEVEKTKLNSRAVRVGAVATFEGVRPTRRQR